MNWRADRFVPPPEELSDKALTQNLVDCRTGTMYFLSLLAFIGSLIGLCRGSLPGIHGRLWFAIALAGTILVPYLITRLIRKSVQKMSRDEKIDAIKQGV